MSTIGLLALADEWYRQAEALAHEYHEVGGWTDGEAYVKYDTLINCRTELLKELKGN